VERRLYLDNAATSFPKPSGVYEAMLRYGQTIGGTAGRGSYREAVEGARLIQQCRQRLCSLINGEDPRHIIFTLNTTDALNLAIKGVVGAADSGRSVHLITSALDHNSILRPFNRLGADDDRITWTCLEVDPGTGLVNESDLRGALRDDTALVALTHASNVTGVVQPIAELGTVCRGARVPFLVDAAQTAGHISIDVGALQVDLLAMPGHKGLLGPLGTGALYIRPGIERQLAPLREGGTGSSSELETQPLTLPDKYEPGSQNALGIVGLSESLAWIQGRGLDHFEHDRLLTTTMLGLLEGCERFGLHLLGPPGADRVGIFSLVHDSLSPHELAALLEQRGILARAGLHCAPRAHGSLGTKEHGGALRLSVGPFITPDDLRVVVATLLEICAAVAPV
jgi:cysteine desulfurase / selenocysteine lyase